MILTIQAFHLDDFNQESIEKHLTYTSFDELENIKNEFEYQNDHNDNNLINLEELNDLKDDINDGEKEEEEEEEEENDNVYDSNLENSNSSKLNKKYVQNQPPSPSFSLIVDLNQLPDLVNNQKS